MRKIKALHIAGEKLHEDAWNQEFKAELEDLLELKIIEDGKKLSAHERSALIRENEILLTNWKCPIVPDCLAKDPGNLKYICNISGSLKKYISEDIIASPIMVSNWGSAPAYKIAEGVMAMLLALLKDLPLRRKQVQLGKWFDDSSIFSTTMLGLNIGLYGLGHIGRKTVEFLMPFEPVIRVFDPYVPSLPKGCINVESKEELFSSSQVISVHAGLTKQTRGSIGAKELAMLPDKGIIINTARGAIINQESLFSELKSGRLKAGLDVLDPDVLPQNHEARFWPNVIFTAHELGKIKKWPGQNESLATHHKNCLENLKNYIAGREILFQLDQARYKRST